jgi:predicted acetyltransferase/ADP-ribose pyrophosphatase YjhB (NUDIX family)
VTQTARAVAVVERGGRILLIRRRRGKHVYAVLPGGGIDPGETAAQAVLRELDEECGLTGTIERVLFEGDHGGRRATYFHIVGTEGTPVLGGVEAFLNSRHNSYEHIWVRSADLHSVGLRPAGLRADLVEALWPTDVRPATDADWPVLERLWQLHRHDLSDTVESVPDAAGLFKTTRLTEYRDEPEHWAHLVLRSGLPIGFALVRRMGSGAHVLGEFFVVRAVRRTGVGRTAVRAVLETHHGEWMVAFQAGNVAAAAFWRSIAAEHFEPGWTEALEPVPGKPEVPADVWLHGSTRGTASGATA